MVGSDVECRSEESRSPNFDIYLPQKQNRSHIRRLHTDPSLSSYSLSSHSGCYKRLCTSSSVLQQSQWWPQEDIALPAAYETVTVVRMLYVHNAHQCHSHARTHICRRPPPHSCTHTSGYVLSQSRARRINVGKERLVFPWGLFAGLYFRKHSKEVRSCFTVEQRTGLITHSIAWYNIPVI